MVRTYISEENKVTLEELFASGMDAKGKQCSKLHDEAVSRTGLPLQVVKDWVGNKRKVVDGRKYEYKKTVYSKGITSYNCFDREKKDEFSDMTEWAPAWSRLSEEEKKIYKDKAREEQRCPTKDDIPKLLKQLTHKIVELEKLGVDLAIVGVDSNDGKQILVGGGKIAFFLKTQDALLQKIFSHHSTGSGSSEAKLDPKILRQKAQKHMNYLYSQAVGEEKQFPYKKVREGSITIHGFPDSLMPIRTVSNYGEDNINLILSVQEISIEIPDSIPEDISTGNSGHYGTELFPMPTVLALGLFCQSYGLHCYTCEDSDTVNGCDNIVKCQAGQHCFIEETLNHALQPVYRSGCIDQQLCKHLQVPINHIVGRKRFAIAGGCCHTELCNDHEPIENYRLSNQSCPQGYTLVDEYCYLVGFNSLTWNRAREFCLKNYGRLADFPDEYTLYNMSRKMFTDINGHIPGTDIFGKPKWTIEKGTVSGVLSNPEHQKRCSPLGWAKFWCQSGLDQDGLEKTYIAKRIGFGVVTQKKFQNGDFILEYVGERIDGTEAKKREQMGNCFIFVFTYSGKTHGVDAEKTLDQHLGGLVNDAQTGTISCNTKMKLTVIDHYPRLCLFATRDIVEGEELRYDYGDDIEKMPWRNPDVSLDTTDISDEDDDPFDLQKEKQEEAGQQEQMTDKAQCTNNETDAKLHVDQAEPGDTGKYTITMTNESGSESAAVNVIILDKPGAPEGPLEVSDVFADSCKLAWNPPTDNGGSDVTGYIVEKCEEGKDYWEKVPGIVKGTSHPVKGLKDGKKYKFRVKAENMYGAGQPLETEKAVLAKNPYDAPDAPKDLDIEKFDKSSVDLVWKKPDNDGGDPIQGYVVEKRPKGGDWVPVNKYPLKDTKYSVMGLKESQVVEFRVSAVNNGGQGKPSEQTKQHTVQDNVYAAGAPGQPNIDNMTPNSAELSWTKPTKDGGGKITGYVVEKKKKGCDWEPATKWCTVDLKELSFTGLIRKQTSPPTKPKGPIKVSNITSDSATLEWQEPEDLGGSGLDGYKVEKKDTKKGQWEAVCEGVKGTKVTVPKLKEGSKYKFRVSAVSPNGTSEPLETEKPIIAKKPYDVPFPPGQPKCVDRDRDHIRIKWEKPEKNGGNPISSYDIKRKEPKTNSWVKVNKEPVTDCEYDDKQVGKEEEYEYRVVANNDAGPSEPSMPSNVIQAKPEKVTIGDPGQLQIDKEPQKSAEISLTNQPMPKKFLKKSIGCVAGRKKRGDQEPSTEISANPIYTKEYQFRVRGINKAVPVDVSKPIQDEYLSEYYDSGDDPDYIMSSETDSDESETYDSTPKITTLDDKFVIMPKDMSKYDDDLEFVMDSSSETERGNTETYPALHITTSDKPLIMQTGLPPESEPDNKDVKKEKLKKENDKIIVMQTSEGDGRIYDKRHYCPYCQKPQAKLPRHLKSMHAEEHEVAKYEIEKNKQKKEQMITKLRNLGNHLHNNEVIEEGKGTFIVKYRPSSESFWGDYVPCDFCLGYYIHWDMWKHRKRCALKPDNSKAKGRVVSKCRLLLTHKKSTETTSELIQVLEKLTMDNIGNVAKNDKIILQLGEKMVKRVGHDTDQFSWVRNTMRELARLLIRLRELVKKEDAQLSDFICPSQFNTIVQATKDVAGYDEQTHLFKTPSLALKIGSSLRNCATIQKRKGLEDSDELLVKESTFFDQLMEDNWAEEVSTHALRTHGENKRNKIKLIPLTSDCKLLTCYLKDKGNDAYEALEVSQSNSEAYRDLSEIVLTQIILFNRRRQGEVSKMKINDYEGCHKEYHDDVQASLSPLEKKLCKILTRIEIVGKRGRTVPVILTESMKKSMDLLLKCRVSAGISAENNFIFANSSRSHIRGSDCLRKFSKDCGAEHPHLLRTTKLRKQIATLTQILNLKENELDILANFLGHDIRVHREFYRLPQQTLEIAKVSKLLISLENGEISTLTGKSLSEVNVPLDEEIELEADLSDEEHDEDDDDDDDDDVIKLQSMKNGTSVECDRYPKDDLINSLPKKKVSGTIVDSKKNLKDHSSHRRYKPRPWTESEKNAVLKHFNRHLALGKIPKKEESENCIRSEPCLSSRTWKNVKDFVRNRISSQKSKSAKVF